MTYIIAEPCIDIKDRSCVDVCPVDCIHEAARILVIDPEECIDCFAPSEQFITSWGIRSFGELEDQLFRMRIQQSLGQLDVPLKLRFTRRDLARIKMVITEKQKKA